MDCVLVLLLLSLLSFPLAQISVLQVFEVAGVSSLVGCSNIPMKNNKYCREHENCDTPIMKASDLQSKSKEDLDSYRKKDSAKEAHADHLYVIESLLEKKGSAFLVKWAGYPKEEATYEPVENIPKYITDYYKQEDKLGKPLPAQED